MNAIKIYSNIVKKNIKNKPLKTRKILKIGYNLQYLKLKILKDKTLPKSLNYLAELCMKFTLDPMKNPSRTSFVNVFAPSEILHSFGVYPQLIEAFSSYVSGTEFEDILIDSAQNNGISETLCSYHKTFIGAALTKTIAKPRFAITTSSACDGNVNTFRCVSNIYDIPNFVIDVPYECSDENIEYVKNQLLELVNFIEINLKEKFNKENLIKIIENENKSIRAYKEYLNILKDKYFPNSLTFEMFKIFATHPGAGHPDTLKFFEMLLDDIKNYPKQIAYKKLLWVHLLPFYSESIGSFLDNNPKYQLLVSDMNCDYLEELDINDPFKSLAKKVILNTYNGPYSRRGDNILKLVKELNADGVINFCHWGCKQSNGGSKILKEILEKNNVPLINLDGDAIDKRNSQEGQNKTRLEAFFEILDTNKGSENNDSLYV